MAAKRPPLKALAAFEAAARHMSFARAAEEFSVSATAITYHVKQVEDHYGLALFTRNGQSVRLTSHGQALYEKVAIALRFIDEASQVVSGMGKRETLVVAAPISFTLKWLMLRAQSFRDQYPQFDLRLRTITQAREGLLSPPDVEIGFGLGGAHCSPEPLFEEIFRPYISTRFPDDLEGRSDLERLPTLPLIHFARSEVSWPRFFDHVGMEHTAQLDDLVFDRAFVALEAAINGLGVVLEGDFVVEKDLAAERLRPLDLPENFCLKSCRYYLRPSSHGRKDKYDIFANWLRQEIEIWKAEKSSPQPSMTRNTGQSNAARKAPAVV